MSLSDPAVPGRVHWLVALPAEARPLIDHYRLRPQGTGPFRVYEDGTGSRRLVVSGVGAVAAAAATGYLAGRSQARAWLNVGLGGHASAPVGSFFLGEKVMDVRTARAAYPQIVFDAPGERGTVCTVDRPEREYAPGNVYDMEASGFFSTAIRFSTAELVHVAKVISDNRETPLETISKGVATECVASRLPEIEMVIESLSELAAEVEAWRADPGEFAEFVERWKFSFTQREQLKGVLERWGLIRSDAALPRCERLRSSSSVLERLRDDLAHTQGELPR